MKENVIVGRLIPAGTGQAYHEDRRARRMKPSMPVMPEETIFADDDIVPELGSVTAAEGIDDVEQNSAE